jgi:hypothetical protein
VATEPIIRQLSHWVRQFVNDRLSNVVLGMVGVISFLFVVHIPKKEKMMMQETDFRRDKSKSSIVILSSI